MSLHQYNKKARARISRAVRWTETQTSERRGQRRRGAHPVSHMIVRAVNSIEHGQVGLVNRLAGPSITQTVSIPSGDAPFNVYNPGQKLWAGSDCIVAPFGLLDSNFTNEASWYVVRAWSATRIRGIVQTASPLDNPFPLAPGQTGTLGTITPIDGIFPYGTTSVYLPTEHVSVAIGVVAWAELVYRTSTGTSRWEIYSADCDEA